MKILYCGLLYNYGKMHEGFSYEHVNIEAGLQEKYGGYFYYPDCVNPGDMSYEATLDIINTHNIDAIFHVAFNESLDLPESFAKLALKKDIPVIQWDCDASWRFNNWILPRKHRVSHFVTTHSHTMQWYKDHGMKVIKSQWAGSPFYKPNRALYKYDCSFIGQKHGQMPDGKFLRSEVVNAMTNAGITVDLFGNYWDGHENWHGYLARFEDVVGVFNTTRINLNLSNPWHYGTMPQIKGRHFEIPQVGGFQLTTPADDLGSYFEPNKEIVIVNDVDELISKTKYYLEHSLEREKIAHAGRERMLKDHQWSHRFDAIFKEVGIL